jgi:hypothetical protein
MPRFQRTAGELICMLIWCRFKLAAMHDACMIFTVLFCSKLLGVCSCCFQKLTRVGHLVFPFKAFVIFLVLVV